MFLLGVYASPILSGFPAELGTTSYNPKSTIIHDVSFIASCRFSVGRSSFRMVPSSAARDAVGIFRERS